MLIVVDFQFQITIFMNCSSLIGDLLLMMVDYLKSDFYINKY